MAPEVVPAETLYLQPDMAPIIFAALKGRDVIARILKEQTGKEVGAQWSPYNPICNRCGRLTATTAWPHTG